MAPVVITDVIIIRHVRVWIGTYSFSKLWKTLGGIGHFEKYHNILKIVVWVVPMRI